MVTFTNILPVKITCLLILHFLLTTPINSQSSKSSYPECFGYSGSKNISRTLTVWKVIDVEQNISVNGSMLEDYLRTNNQYSEEDIIEIIEFLFSFYGLWYWTNEIPEGYNSIDWIDDWIVNHNKDILVLDKETECELTLAIHSFTSKSAIISISMNVLVDNSTVQDLINEVITLNILLTVTK